MPKSEDRVEVQEFYCRHCRGDTGGYFIVRISTGLNRRLTIHCPECGSKHMRGVTNGLISESAYHEHDRHDHIHVPKSAWSPTPRTRAMREARERFEKLREDKQWAHESEVGQLRNGAPICDVRDIIDEAWRDRYLGRYQEEQ